MNKQLVIVGDSAFAEIAFEYFTHDSEYEVVGFSVESEFRKKDTLFDLPVVDFESVSEYFDPESHSVYVAIVYTQLNRLRARLVTEAKEKGYSLASYISSRAFVWENVSIGEHCFIFEDNTVQPFVKIEDNVVLWSGNHIGHHSTIRAHNFISSHVVVSGFCDIGENGFLGVNATLANNITLSKDNWVGPGVLITKDSEPGQFFKTDSPEPARVSTYRYFKVKQD